jgi:hypothetical protein
MSLQETDHALNCNPDFAFADKIGNIKPTLDTFMGTPFCSSARSCSHKMLNGRSSNPPYKPPFGSAMAVQKGMPSFMQQAPNYFQSAPVNGKVYQGDDGADCADGMEQVLEELMCLLLCSRQS